MDVPTFTVPGDFDTVVVNGHVYIRTPEHPQVAQTVPDQAAVQVPPAALLPSLEELVADLDDLVGRLRAERSMSRREFFDFGDSGVDARESLKVVAVLARTDRGALEAHMPAVHELLRAMNGYARPLLTKASPFDRAAVDMECFWAVAIRTAFDVDDDGRSSALAG